ncbi:2-methylaconitate cis-trans isomerase PrpF family protein [Nisaea sediminum]|uniref:2-methylaconitate cis-trans isomerase PrpF family protein n=1 Tax=Nisaea sediminum TaxID=2775867 RepID=UPI0018683E2E|nr:PrpF domain-containing protein [Nisaea sediminum]
MPSIRIPACFMRGGSSKGVFFAAADLPAARAEWDPLFLSVIGSPDPYGRQLNGMGGGVSSLSKAAVISASLREEADLDFTFTQVAVGEALVDYSSNCGNLSSAVAPFALERGLIQLEDGPTSVRIFNTNTSKILIAHFQVSDGRAVETGTFAIPGVSGTGAAIRLEFLDPAGAGTGRLFPSGNLKDRIVAEDGRVFEATLLDVGNPCVFLDAGAFGRTANETIRELESDTALMALLEELRRKAAVLMGLAEDESAAPSAVPKIAIVGVPLPAKDLAGNAIDPEKADLAVRMLSMENVHRVLPLTGAMCSAVASRIPGTVPADLAKQADGDVRLANPSGILPIGTDVSLEGAPTVRSVTVIRTARLLMTGEVVLPA